MFDQEINRMQTTVAIIGGGLAGLYAMRPSAAANRARRMLTLTRSSGLGAKAEAR